MKIKEYCKNLKDFNWRIFIALCVVALFPAIYQMIRTFLISTTVSTEAFDIIGQMEWFDLINETLQAFLIIPLYSILNKIFKKKEERFGESVFKTLIVSFVLYALFSLGIFFYGVYLISAMNSNDINVSEVNAYLQLETVAFMIGIIVSFVNVVFVVVGKSRNMYIMLIINSLLLILTDFLFIPNMGVNGVAISNIIVNVILSIAGLIILVLQKYLIPKKYEKEDFRIAKEWAVTGLFSGAQSFIDNFIYAIMICKMVNMVAEQGNYWNANNFIWGWLLIPITALGEIIRTDCKIEYKSLKQSNYYLIVIFTTILWLISIPLWTPYYKYGNRLENANEIFLITLKLFPFYIAYALCMIPDNIFIGYGNTKYNAINSLIINIVYYGIFFLFFKLNILTFNMNVIILMFGFGMVTHLFISLIEEKIFFKKELNLKIKGVE